MGTVRDPIKCVLQFITGESSNMCRLCFDETNTAALSIEDNAKLVSPYFEGVVTYTDMLMNLNVTEEPLMPSVLCQKCTNILTKAYLFQKLIQYSNRKWHEALKKIDSTLDLSISNQPQHNAQTVHFLLDDNKSQIFSSRRKIKSKQAVLFNLKNFVRQRKFQNNAKKKSQPQFVCEECGDGFLSSQHLSKHMLIHTGKKYHCRECPKSFRTIISLKNHIERQHSPKDIQCPKCSKMVSTERLLKIHDDREHKASVCKSCLMNFSSRKALLQHINKHAKFQCPLCEKTYINKQSFQIHIKGCGVQDAYPSVYCDICNQCFKRKNTLRTHLKLKHGFGTEYYNCNWCSKKFDAASRLRNHIVKHTKEKNFHCEQCGGMFVTQAALVYHIRLHTGEKPFKCDLCDESFLSASRRMDHKRRKHFGPQRQCTYCDRRFVSGHSLKIHMDRHKNPHSKLFIGETDSKINIDRNLQ